MMTLAIILIISGIGIFIGIIYKGSQTLKELEKDEKIKKELEIKKLKMEVEELEKKRLKNKQ